MLLTHWLDAPNEKIEGYLTGFEDGHLDGWQEGFYNAEDQLGAAAESRDNPQSPPPLPAADCTPDTIGGGLVEQVIWGTAMLLYVVLWTIFFVGMALEHRL